MMTLRVTQDMKDGLSAAAEMNGRSLSQEVELRLEQSLRADAELGGPDQAEILRTIAYIMSRASERLGPWQEEPAAWRVVAEATTRLLMAFEPSPDSSRKPEPLKVTPTVQRALDAYEAAMEEWQPIAHDRRMARLRVFMRAHSPEGVPNADRESADRAIREFAGLPPEPVPDLPPPALASWKAERAWADEIELADRYATAVTDALLRRLRPSR